MNPRVPVATPARIAPLANLPLFHRIAGRKVLVIGESAGTDWKAELVAAAGADVRRIKGDWQPEDFRDAALAIADLPDDTVALRFVEEAHAAGVLVNVIDQTELCDVQFGTIVNRSPVVVAISTDGAAPVLGQSIRERIESVLPFGLSHWAKAAKAWRPRLRAQIGAFADRRRFWQRFAEAAWRDPEREPTDQDFDALVAAQASGSRGSVTLVGAGPGDPELLTLKAVRALQRATYILYDDLVGPDILELARREAIRIAVGKTGYGPSCSQAEITARLVALAEAGETVIRLKGGDPLIFGRAAEEIKACRAAGIAVGIIPGISAGQGAAAALGISLTERKRARRVQFVTGHGADGRLPQDIDWGAVADRKATTLLYMPRRTLPQFVRMALAKGLDPATPAVAVAAATLPDQRHIGAPIIDLVTATSELPPGAPMVVIIGWVGRREVAIRPALLEFDRALAS